MKIFIRIIEHCGYALTVAITMLSVLFLLHLFTSHKDTGLLIVATYLLAGITVGIAANVGLLLAADTQVHAVRVGFGPRLVTFTRPHRVIEVRLLPLYLRLQVTPTQTTRIRKSLLEAYGGSFAIAVVATGILTIAMPDPWRLAAVAGGVAWLVRIFAPVRSRERRNTGAGFLELLVVEDIPLDVVNRVAARLSLLALSRGDLTEAQKHLQTVEISGNEPLATRLRVAVLRAEGDFIRAANLLEHHTMDEPHNWCTHAYILLLATEAEHVATASSLPTARASLDKAREFNCPGPRSVAVQL